MRPADDPVLPIAERLLGCLCAQLPETVGGDVCSCCLHPGQSVPVDYCCECDVGGEAGEGQAWVRPGRIYPTSGRFPVQLVDAAPCPAGLGLWAVELVLGVYRCAAAMDDDGEPPSCDRTWGDTEKLLSDAAALRAAISCCFPNMGDPGEGDPPVVVVGGWESLGPSGGCVGGQMTVTVQFSDCCPDGEES